MKFAIVDIETTGGSAYQSSITEVAVLLYEDGKVEEVFHSLINPGVNIPSYITTLTGITNQMVENAPRFDEVAHDLYTILEPYIFVAHNVNFDYSFLSEAFKRCGLVLKTKKLCTVRLSRQIFPGQPTYSLGDLCTSLSIPLNDRHRAMGDAKATAILFERLLQSDDRGVVQKSLGVRSKEMTLPPHVPREIFDNLPSGTGVYYFHDAQGKIIYVGKAVNIQQRIYSHFTGSRAGKLMFLSDIHDITYVITGSELAALLLESAEIKKHFPKYNQAQKISGKFFCLYHYEDQKGIIRLVTGKKIPGYQAVRLFNNLDSARSFMFQLIEKFELCPKCCGMETSTEACYSYQQGKCKGVCCGKELANEYNVRVGEALDFIRSENGSRLITDKGRSPDERCIVVIKEGVYKGFGYVSSDLQIYDIEDAMNYITPYQDNLDIQRILKGWIKDGLMEAAQI